MDSKSNDALLILTASAVLLLVVYRPIPRLDALPGGRDDSRILVLTFTCSLLLSISRFFDLIVNGSLRSNGSP